MMPSCWGWGQHIAQKVRKLKLLLDLSQKFWILMKIENWKMKIDKCFFTFEYFSQALVVKSHLTWLLMRSLYQGKTAISAIFLACWDEESIRLFFFFFSLSLTLQRKTVFHFRITTLKFGLLLVGGTLASAWVLTILFFFLSFSS